MNVSIFFIILALINFFLYKYLNQLSKTFKIYDIPDNDRKLHKIEVPLLGGIFIFFSFLLYLFFLILSPSHSLIQDFNFINLKNFITFFICCFSLLLVGIYDDKFNLNANIKLFLLASLIAITISLNTELQINVLRFEVFNEINLGYLSLPFTILCILLFINAFNMFDGINMQSGFYSSIFFVYFLIINAFVSLSIVMIISIFFFLINNSKSKLFLGDSGSIFISFLISMIIIHSYNDGYIRDVDTIFILMMLPGIDMFRLFILRIWKRSNPFKSDRNHLHHLFIINFGCKKTLFYIQLLIIIPILLSFLINKIFVAVTTILIYIFVIKSLYKKSKSF